MNRNQEIFAEDNEGNKELKAEDLTADKIPDGNSTRLTV
jgi:hypothetical protein